MKPRLKLGFADTHEHLAEFFFYVLSTRYDIEMSFHDPDFLIFGDENFGTQNKKYSKKNCTKIFYTGENRRPENYDCHYAITFDHNLNPWHYRLPLYIIYMWSLQHIHKTKYTYDYIFNAKVAPKTDFCSFVVSNGSCAERNNFFQKLSEYKKVDSAGRHFKNVTVNLDGEQKKIDFLSTRKFNICFESQSHPGYVTEKILHAFYSKTVPIYWGSPTIDIDFNRSAFINVHDFPSFEHAIEYVKTVDSNDSLYDKILNQPAFSHSIPPSYYLIDNFLNWFDAVVYKKRGGKDEISLVHL
jgi:hypothetical protein